MHLFLSRSLRGRLLILVLLVATSLCALAALLIWQACENERAAVYRELGNTARATASLAAQRLENMELLLRGLTAPAELERDELEAFQARAARLTVPGRRWVVVATPDGRQLVNTAAPPGATLPVDAIDEDNVAAVAAGQAYYSNIFLGPLVKKPLFFASIGVPDGAAPRYYVSLAMSPEEFAAGTFMASTPRSHVVSVIDREGLIVARNHNAEKYVGRGPTPDIAAAARLRREILAPSRTLEGREVLAAVVPIPRAGWSIAVGAPVSSIQGSARRLMLTGFFTSLAILCAATGVAWWIARAAIHDVNSLLEDSRQVAAGELPAHSATVLLETSAIAASLRDTSSRLHEELRERRRAEAALSAAKDELTLANLDLEAKVAQRTASLAELVRQMEEFTYSISHDLRSPVRAMTGFGRIVLEEHSASLPVEARGFLERIVAAGERMGRLIHDLLSFSRVNQHELALAPVDLDRLLRECVHDHPVIGQHAERIAIEGPLPIVLGHETFLHQSLVNLLSNAIKFIHPGVEPRIRIHAEPRGDFVRLWVGDNGIGIEPTLHPKLFHVFERVHGDRRFEGTGIGLAIVRRAIERMGGRVGVESDGVNGSRFWLELRLAQPVV